MHVPREKKDFQNFSNVTLCIVVERLNYSIREPVLAVIIIIIIIIIITKTTQFKQK